MPGLGLCVSWSGEHSIEETCACWFTILFALWFTMLYFYTFYTTLVGMPVTFINRRIAKQTRGWWQGDFHLENHAGTERKAAGPFNKAKKF